MNVLLATRKVDFLWDSERKALCSRTITETTVSPIFKSFTGIIPICYFDDEDEAERWLFKQIDKGAL